MEQKLKEIVLLRLNCANFFIVIAEVFPALIVNFQPLMVLNVVFRRELTLWCHRVSKKGLFDILGQSSLAFRRILRVTGYGSKISMGMAAVSFARFLSWLHLARLVLDSLSALISGSEFHFIYLSKCCRYFLVNRQCSSRVPPVLKSCRIRCLLRFEGCKKIASLA